MLPIIVNFLGIQSLTERDEKKIHQTLGPQMQHPVYGNTVGTRHCFYKERRLRRAVEIVLTTLLLNCHLVGRTETVRKK